MVSTQEYSFSEQGKKQGQTVNTQRKGRKEKYEEKQKKREKKPAWVGKIAHGLDG